MKKRFLTIISVLLIIMTVFSMASCGGAKNNTDSEDSEEVKETEVKQPDDLEAELNADEKAYVIYDSTLEDEEGDSDYSEEEDDNGTEAIPPSDMATGDMVISSATKTTVNLRIGSYNIQHGAGNKSLDKIAANITAQKLDVVAIQEADNGTKRSGRVDQMKKLSDLTGYKYYKFFKAINHDGGEYGIGILSKYKFETSKCWDLPNGSYENRVFARVQIKVDGVLLNFYATHLSYDGESAAMRKKQLAEIANIVKDNSNFVIAGDFNTGKFSEFDVLDNHETYQTITLNRENHMKYTEPSSKLAIDNIVFRGWTFGKPQVVTASYSDHYMLWGDGVFETVSTNIVVGESTSKNTVTAPPQRDGNKVVFGTYPQSRVINSSLLSTLNSKAGTPVTNGKSWSSYKYTENANMYYIDVEEGGERYRGIYFTKYRPTDVRGELVSGNSLQDDNGYKLNVVYWFKHEPVSWTVLDEKDGKLLLHCDLIIDSQAYSNTAKNNYANSTIRAWLNGAFLDTAFSEVQKNYILTTEVDNGLVASDYKSANPFICENTNDKIFLLSKAEVKNAEYGFTGDSARVMKATAYAESQGVFANDSNDGWWWLRTPSNSASISTKDDLAHNIKVVGSIWSTNVAISSGGIVPAMWIDLGLDDDNQGEDNGNVENGDNENLENGDNGNVENGDNENVENGDNENVENGDNENVENGDNGNVENGDNGNLEEEVKDYAPVRNGNKVTFGSYPQSSVTNSSLIATLNGKVATPKLNASAWTAYGYYGNSNIWFVDVEEGGERYRGVYFTAYSPTNLKNPANADNSLQDDNGYKLNTVHWFKYEPISWTILEEKDGNALVLCDMIIDAQAYDTGDNNYANSTIRAWLNDNFINTAFTELQRELILTTEVDNGLIASDYKNGNPYLCENTNDKIFLLSKAEVKNSAYGFTSDSIRVMKATAYAESQGVFANDSSVGWWWLRTPSNVASISTKNDLAHNIKVAGSIWSTNVTIASGGVVPAMWIKL